MKHKIVIGDNEIEVTDKQKLFCELYVTKDFFANGTQSYIEAYDIDVNEKGSYQTAKSNAYRLLTNADLLLYINHLLDLSGLNDEFIDKQLTLLITQNADFRSKLGAIREYNKLKNRVRNKIDVNIKEKLPSREERDKYLKEFRDDLKKEMISDK